MKELSLNILDIVENSTKAKAEMTESSPMVMFSKACRRYPFHVCHR